MGKSIVIDQVTRIEGHSKITIHLNDAGEVEDAVFHVTQLRGFEKFVEGRPFHEMPSIFSRICGICPVSHLVASAKACDMLMSVQIPPTAIKLRRIINLAQIAQSHALSFFYLSSPDLLLGMDADPATRNILGVASVNPELAAGGIRIRQVGQQIIETLADKRIHPGWVVGGGVNKPLSKEDRDKLSALIPQAMTAAESALKWFIAQLDRFSEEIANFCNFPTLYLALAGPNNELETYDGLLRVVDDDGRDVVGKVQPKDFATIIDEEISPHSYLKSPYFKPLGISAGVYRVGPLARMHMASTCGTPRADEALKEFQHLDHRSSFYYHYARLIEIIYAFEMIQRLLDDAEILDEHVRAFASPNAFEGIGVAEAPRGTLMHHYKIDENGLITYADLVIATGHNNLAMNMGITQAAKHFIKGENISEGILNRIEAVIRTFDPCLSCSTHAFGQMPLHIQLLASDGSVLDEVKR